MTTKRRSFDYFPYMLLAPAILLSLLIVAWPFVETFRLSFTNATMGPKVDFVGLENYRKMFAGDFPQVIVRTFIWMVVSVSLKMTIGLLGAVLLNASVPGRTLARLLVMPPWIVPIAISAFIWGWLYNGQFGMISGVAQNLGILSGPFEFLAFRNSAFMAAVVVDVWVGTPLISLYLLAAMQSVPTDLHEAAWTDGASRVYRFRRITLPLISPAIATISLLSAIWTFNSFDIIWILTEGGPRDATTTMIVDTYKTAISRFHFGEGSARAVMIVVFLGLFSFLYFLLLQRLSKSRDKS